MRQKGGIQNIKAACNLVALCIDPVRTPMAPYCICTELAWLEIELLARVGKKAIDGNWSWPYFLACFHGVVGREEIIQTFGRGQLDDVADMRSAEARELPALGFIWTRQVTGLRNE